MDKALDVIVAKGVRAAKALMTDAVFSRGGIPGTKTRSQRRDETLRLDILAEVLDELQWYGEWGQTPHAIRMELSRRARTTEENR